ncbi:phenylacetate--CoA ligase family protein [Pseudoalteromonas piscicida]|uniref:Polysaccharide biosynthesis protein n=1 Tax=Pseudoalteromonas piscicida TaxID=43662 RepID=A0A2A5JVX6_PSEO7|nr:phenylacetate--CoA ligase family protein [Pseudoalteromonas piscicida]PCK33605.1 polysaccharide biosynthesis protein [Pseudoalteromonas piscicida]
MNTSKIARILPTPLFDILISIFNKLQYVTRRAGQYKKIRKERASFDSLGIEQLREIQNNRFIEFVNYAKTNSPYFKKQLQGIDVSCVADIKLLPMLEKTTLINELSEIATIKESEAIVSYTGGTTGASMKVLYKKSCMQERFAYLDNFRAQFGYELGAKVAWFSGKNLLCDRDVRKRRFFKDDYINKIRFFSTFHITPEHARHYFRSLEEFQPKYLVGFPSSVLRICKYAESQGLKYKGKVEVFFPTAEMVTKEHREVIGRVLGCRLVDQYASSEGAPFIFECNEGNLHIDITSGVFEVLDEEGNDTQQGELVVTAFGTKGTPLIRYRVGDRLTLSERTECPCGNHMPLAENIGGRKDDFIVSPTLGEVNLGNISNSTKAVSGIICFQIEQRELDKITVRVVPSSAFDEQQQNKFVSALSERMGEKVEINFELVKEIPVEKSGKFRIIKNMLKAS